MPGLLPEWTCAPLASEQQRTRGSGVVLAGDTGVRVQLKGLLPLSGKEVTGPEQCQLVTESAVGG